MFARLGVDLGRATLCNWAMQVAQACVPLVNLIRDDVLEGRVINIDETTVQVLAEPGRVPTLKSNMWLFRRGDPVKPAMIYQYHPTRAGDVAREFLGDYQGVIQTDGYTGFGFLDYQKGVRHAGCWAHVRRKFMEVVKAQGKNRKSGSADQALAFVQQLYGLEKEARLREQAPEALLALRPGPGPASLGCLSPVAPETLNPDPTQGPARQVDQLCLNPVGSAGGVSGRAAAHTG